MKSSITFTFESQSPTLLYSIKVNHLKWSAILGGDLTGLQASSWPVIKVTLAQILTSKFNLSFNCTCNIKRSNLVGVEL